MLERKRVSFFVTKLAFQKTFFLTELQRCFSQSSSHERGMIHLSFDEMKSSLDFEDFGDTSTVRVECLFTVKSCSPYHVCG